MRETGRRSRISCTCSTGRAKHSLSTPKVRYWIACAMFHSHSGVVRNPCDTSSSGALEMRVRLVLARVQLEREALAAAADAFGLCAAAFAAG